MKKTNSTSASAPTKDARLPEAVLHYLWKTKNFPIHSLITTSGQKLSIQDFGTHNHVAGPDFLNAQITCGMTKWAGHVEMHVKSSDWYRHHHHVDPAYDQVVLHVVWEDDRPVSDLHLTPIPTLILKDLVDDQVLDRAMSLISAKDKLPCAASIRELSPFYLNAWKERQLIERLEYRTAEIHRRLKEVHGDWEQLALEFLGRSLGFHANSDQMQALAQEVTWRRIRKVHHDEKEIEALLFGRAGMLNRSFEAAYPQELKSRYEFLEKKYQFKEAPMIKWNFKGARPSNFPTVRIAQFASIIQRQPSLLRKLIETGDLSHLKALFQPELSTFWSNHYVLHKPTERARNQLSLSSIQLLLINYAIPVLYAYGKEQNREAFERRAITFLYALSAEKNAVLRRFEEAGVANNSAADSQALLHTYRQYCSVRRCLDCQVGCRIISRT